MPLAGKQLQRGVVIDGQFELERQLGAGGMGTVWAATDLRLGRSVAVKFLSSAFAFDESARQRFEREARLSGRIRSPHVVQVFSQGLTDDGVPYVVMELLDGEDLSYRIARGGPCGLVETASIVEQLCRALSRAHQSGLVHRDIKPHNIFLLPETGGMFVKLLDFGIAKDIGAQLQSLTLTGSMLGTVLYCSPEQLRDPQSVGPLSDIWSLGVVIYQMLTGVTPFHGETMPDVVVKITEGRYVPATRIQPALPAAIDELFEQLLQVNAADRLQSAEEVAEALAAIVRANSSTVQPRTQATGRPWPRRASSRAATARWQLALLTALLTAAATYFLTISKQQPIAADTKPLDQSAPNIAPATPAQDARGEAAPGAVQPRAPTNSAHDPRAVTAPGEHSRLRGAAAPETTQPGASAYGAQSPRAPVSNQTSYAPANGAREPRGATAVQNDTRARATAAPAEQGSGVAASTESRAQAQRAAKQAAAGTTLASPQSAQTLSRAAQPEQRAPSSPAQTQESHDRSEPPDPSSAPPSAAALDPESSEPKRKASTRRDFGF